MEREPSTRFSQGAKERQLSLDLAFLKKNITIDLILKSAILLQSSRIEYIFIE